MLQIQPDGTILIMSNSLLQEPDVSVDQLLGALLNAQLQQNEMLGKLLTQLNQESQARQIQFNALTAWKEKHPQVVERCKDIHAKLDTIFAHFVIEMLDALGDMDFEPDIFTTREFVDKYGFSLTQLNVILQVVTNLSQ